MAANPTLWADVSRDLADAAGNANRASARTATLRMDADRLDPDDRLDREYAIGVMLHNAYGAMESALERLIVAIDGTLPSGGAYHADLVRRAETAIPGIRPAILRSKTAADLHRLRAFRPT